MPGETSNAREPRVETPPARTSALAWTALVLAVLGFCPPISAAGSVLGMLAAKRIRESGGRLKGRRVANTAVIAGMCVSIAGALAWSSFVNRLQRWLDEESVRQVERFMHAAQSGEATTALLAWRAIRESHPPAEAIEGFGADTLERYGGLRAFRVTSTVVGGAVFASRLDVAGTFEFERATLPGSASFTLEPSAGWAMPLLRLRSLTIDDASRGRLSLGEPATNSIPATSDAQSDDKPTSPNPNDT